MPDRSAQCELEGREPFGCAIGFDRPNGWGVFLIVHAGATAGGTLDPRDVDVQPSGSTPSVAYHPVDDATWIASIYDGPSASRGQLAEMSIRDFEYTPLPARSGTGFLIEATGVDRDAINFTTRTIRPGPRRITITGVIDGQLCPASVEMCDALMVPRGRRYYGP